MSEGPVEPPGGQESDAPDLRALLTELFRHLKDLRDTIPEETDVGARNGALLRAVQRYRQAHFDEEDD